MKYYLLKISSEQANDEINFIAFSKYHCLGIEEFNLSEKEVDQILGRDALLGAEVDLEIISRIERAVKGQSICYLFSMQEDLTSFQEFLMQRKIDSEIELRDIEDWNKEWKKHFSSVIISPRLKVVPEWEKPEQMEGIILINPGMGFGTGTHETTYLCLKLLDEISMPPRKCLDLGCGSGILGIASIKLFASSVDFVDVSREALTNCHENLILNFDSRHLTGSSLVLRERFMVKPEYDLVFANILKDVLLKERDLMIGALKPKGKMIVSGLLNDQLADFIIKFNDDERFKVLETRSKGDWCAILMEAR